MGNPGNPLVEVPAKTNLFLPIPPGMVLLDVAQGIMAPEVSVHPASLSQGMTTPLASTHLFFGEKYSY